KVIGRPRSGAPPPEWLNLDANRTVKIVWCWSLGGRFARAAKRSKQAQNRWHALCDAVTVQSETRGIGIALANGCSRPARALPRDIMGTPVMAGGRALLFARSSLRVPSVACSTSLLAVVVCRSRCSLADQ